MEQVNNNAKPDKTWTYSAGNQNATASNIVRGTTSASWFAHGLSLPPESMVILRSSASS